MLFRRRQKEPDRPNCIAIMNEAMMLKREMDGCTDPTRGEAILARMRVLAVEIGALPADSPLVAAQSPGGEQ